LVARLAAIPYTGAISDILDEMGLTKQVLPKEIQSIHPGQTLAGRSLTLLDGVTVSTDPDVIFRPFLRMLGEVRPGDLLVSQPNDSGAAHLGELSCETAQHRGARGAVIDGGVRDVDYIIKLGFPCLPDIKPPATSTGVGAWLITTCPS
jgi:regulator of RNase E activity RraA